MKFPPHSVHFQIVKLAEPPIYSSLISSLLSEEGPEEDFMKVAKFGMAVIGFLTLIAFGQAAQAQVLEDVTPIVGVWEDRLPDGSFMVTTISSGTVSFLMVNREGYSSGPPTTIEVTFSKYDKDSYLATPLGNIGQPMAFKTNTKDSIFIQFEGRDPRTLNRQQNMNDMNGNIPSTPSPHKK